MPLWVEPVLNTLPQAQCTVTSPGREVAIYAIYPLHPDEMQHKLEHGADSLFERLDAAGVTDQVDPDRPSVMVKSGRGGRTRRSD